MSDSMISLAMLGTWEIIIILGILLLMAAAVVGVVFLAIWLSRRNGKTPITPSHAASTLKLATCPRCGIPLPSNAPQGLCPRCVFQVGLGTQDAGDPAFRDTSGKPNPPDPAELAKHFPQLEIIELLGQGGMGAVYKARQKDLDRVVALKVLPGGPGGDPAFAERFTREARALARLSHPNIVAVHEFGQVEAGTGLPPVSGGANTDRRSVPLYYFIMEFIDGPNLRQLMHGQKLSPREALSIVPKICEALQFAHDEGIVHRDIKPENILLDTKGRVKIADFGIAKILGKGRDATLTGAKDVIGTPHYMAPEQVEHPTEVDHRADIYSLGVVFYEMLTGELPLGKFEVPSHRVQVDVRLDEVVMRSLAKAPERRYQHASEVKTDVETIAASEGSAAPAEESTPPSRGSADKRAWFAPLVVVREGQRVIHWPGVALDSFLLAGIYVVSWLFAVLLLSPFVGTPHVGALFGGMLGFLAAMLAIGFYRSSKTPTQRLRRVDRQTPETEPEPARWQPLIAALLLVGCVLLWAAVGFVTYVLPRVVERFASQETELPALTQFIFQVGGAVHHFEVLLVPLLVLATGGSFVWLFVSATRSQRRPLLTSEQEKTRVWTVRKAWGFGIAALCFVVATIILGEQALRDSLSQEASNVSVLALLNLVAAMGFGAASYRYAQATRGGSSMAPSPSATSNPVAADGKPGNSRRFTSTAAAADSHFSRLAVFGAGWAGFALLAVMFKYIASAEGGPGQSPTALGLALAVTLLPLGLTAPVGTTLCGVVALSQIRRSGGRLCGLGLALFDALLFPLLILNGLIVWLVYLLMCQSLVWVGFNPGTEVALETALPPAALIIVVVNAWLVRWAWRTAKRMSGRVPTRAELVSATTWMRMAVPVSALLVIGAAVLMVVTPLQAQRRAEGLRAQQQEKLAQLKDQADKKRGPTMAAASASIAAPTRVPPVVLRTQPESGSANVDPSLTELRVTFSKPMQDGYWSWVKLDDETYPKTTGQTWLSEDGLTCILPVQLQPGKTYATWINVDNFQNFQDRNRNPAVPYLLVFETTASALKASNSPDDEAPRLVTVGQDGGAQFTSIQDAIDTVAAGGTVQIGAGRYAERLKITNAVQLIGAGWENTVIGPTEAMAEPTQEQMRALQQAFSEAQSDADRTRLREEASRQLSPPVVFIRGARSALLEGLRLTQPGVAPKGKLMPGTVIEVRAGELALKDCAVVGSPGNGVVLTEGTSCDIGNTLIAAVWKRGVAVDGGSRLNLHESDIRNCYYAGVTIKGGSKAAIERCRISGAAWHGIRYDDVSPRIEGNLIFSNARCGIYASGETAAQVGHNVFFNNEMSGISCWSDNKDMIEGNTFADNQREALSILGASAPAVRSNIFSGHPVALHQGYIGGQPDSITLGRPLVLDNLFWNNVTNWVRATRADADGVWQSEAVELDDATQSRVADPMFANDATDDFHLLLDSRARQDGIGAADSIPAASPWPLQPEEHAIIPDGETRDSRQWKRPGQ